MKIINIDCPKHLAEQLEKIDIFSFIRETFSETERQFDELMNRDLRLQPWYLDKPDVYIDIPVRKNELEVGCFKLIANLRHNIPIFLKSVRDKTEDNEDNIVDLLGAYFPNRMGTAPYIELYVSSIYDEASHEEETFKWLFTVILIHELSHATLDINNCINVNASTPTISYKSAFGRWREESIANALTLHVIKISDNSQLYKYAKRFMMSQPQEYALGALIGESLEYWDIRTQIENKRCGVHPTLQQEWLAYAQNSPDIDGLRNWNELLIRKNVYFYCGKYYKKEGLLAHDIAMNTVADYEKKNGRKMSLAEFSSIFPKIRTSSGISYVESSECSEDHRYEQTIVLQDATIALYYFFDNRTLPLFVSNSDQRYTIYQNY